MTDALEGKSFRWLFDAAVDPMLVADGSGTVIHANKAAQQLFGYPLAEFCGLAVEALIPERFRDRHRAHRAEFARNARRLAIAGRPELYGLRRDGTEFAADISLSPMEDGLVLATVHDISERKCAEAALRELRGEMEELLELHVASQTAAAIAHELNQPLNAVVSYTEAALRLLRAGNPNPESLLRALEGSAHQAQRAGLVVRQLLELLQKGESETEAVDLNEAIRRAIAIVESNGYGGFQVVLDLAPELKPVQASRLQVEKVLANLLRNSVEAMRSAGVATWRITITIRSLADGNMAQVTVRDSGPGLDEHTAGRIFEPFFTTKPKGIGMGLAISRTLVEAHGGRLWFEAGPGPGATFHFTLPFAA